MKRQLANHLRIYYESFGYDTELDGFFAPCEITEAKGQDVHHIIGRGKRGPDRIENLMLLSRDAHVEYGDKTDYMVLLFKIHRKRLDMAEIPYDNKWFEKQIRKYEGLIEMQKIRWTRQ